MSSKPKFFPMPGKIVAQVIGEREVYGAGLILRSPTVNNPRTTAKVIAVYEPFMVNDTETESYVKVDDIVIFGMHSGIMIEYGLEKVIILREQEILTIIKVEDEEAVEEIGVAREGTFDDIDG
jgi:co-chaperonin GroES (HSP10)